MAREYIEKYDLLNTGREKLNRSIDKSYDAEETSVQALKDANDLGNQAKQISTTMGQQSINDANRLGNEALIIAKENEKVANEANNISKDTNDKMNQIISSTTNSAEVIDARVDEETLGKKIRQMDSVILKNSITDDISILNYFVENDNFDVGGTMQPFYKKRQDEIIEKLNKDLFSFLVLTDGHHQTGGYAPNQLAHYQNATTLTKKTDKIDALILGGDNINGYYDRNRILTETEQVTSLVFNTISDSTDVLFSFGNHDNGVGQNGKNKPEQCLLLSEIKKLYNLDELYYFRDYEEYKVRLIILNSFDLPETTNEDGTYKYNFIEQSGFGGEQLKWLAEKALILPSNEWHVVIFSHAQLSGSFGTIPQYNTTEIITILNGFQNGTSVSINKPLNELPVFIESDFSIQGKGVLAAFINGHVHSDGQMIYKGINCIMSQASLCYENDEKRKVGTESEDSWDVFSIDKANRTISIYRFGQGNDRITNY